jgi:hypothetical protein
MVNTYHLQGGVNMKKLSLCIGVFLVLFLVVGSYTVQAQPYTALEQMNGKWLKMNGSVKGYDFGVAYDPAATGDAYSVKFNQYACVSYDPAGTNATMAIYDKQGNSIGNGYLSWVSGTDDAWLAAVEIYLVADQVSAFMPMIVKTKDSAEKGSFKSITVTGSVGPIPALQDRVAGEKISLNGGWANYFGGKVNATIVKRVPFDVICEGYVPVPP